MPRPPRGRASRRPASPQEATPPLATPPLSALPSSDASPAPTGERLQRQAAGSRGGAGSRWAQRWAAARARVRQTSEREWGPAWAATRDPRAVARLSAPEAADALAAVLQAQARLAERAALSLRAVGDARARLLAAGGAVAARG